MGWGSWQPFVGPEGVGAPAWPGAGGAGSVCSGPGTGKAFPLSLSAHGKPRAGVGGVPVGPRRAMGALRLFRCLGDPRDGGMALPCHHLPLSHSRAWGLRRGSDSSSPTEGTGLSLPDVAPSRGCVTPGTAGLYGRCQVEGKKSCQ